MDEVIHGSNLLSHFSHSYHTSQDVRTRFFRWKGKKLGNGTSDDNKTMNRDESRYETRSSVDPANPEFSGLMKSWRKPLREVLKNVFIIGDFFQTFSYLEKKHQSQIKFMSKQKSISVNSKYSLYEFWMTNWMRVR